MRDIEMEILIAKLTGKPFGPEILKAHFEKFEGELSELLKKYSFDKFTKTDSGALATYLCTSFQAYFEIEMNKKKVPN